MKLSGPGLGHPVLSDEATEKDWFSGSFIKTAPDGQTQHPPCLFGCGVSFP